MHRKVKSKKSRSKRRYSRKRVSNQKRRSKIRKNTRKKSRQHAPVKRRKNTYRRNSQRGGVSSDDIIMKTIMKTIEDKSSYYFALTKDGDCFRSGDSLLSIIRKHYTVTRMKQPIKWSNITDYINTGEGHLIFKVSSPGHVWFLEVKYGNFRILSVWEGEHGFYDYYQKGEYGQFRGSSEFGYFKQKLTELNGIELDTHVGETGTWEGTTEIKQMYAAQEFLFGVRQYTDDVIDEIAEPGLVTRATSYFFGRPREDINQHFPSRPTITINYGYLLT